MSDQLTGLGGATLFRVIPNWQTEPAEEQQVSRNFQEFAGTRRDIFLLSPYTPIRLSLGFLLEQAEIKSFLDFVASVRGEWGAFWLLSALNHFTLVGNYHAGDKTLSVERTSFLYNYVGHERVYLQKTNGDLLTFALASVSPGLDEGDPMLFELVTALAADLENEDVARFGQLLYGRFDQDDFSLVYGGGITVTTEVAFQELIKEYPA